MRFSCGPTKPVLESAVIKLTDGLEGRTAELIDVALPAEPVAAAEPVADAVSKPGIDFAAGVLDTFAVVNDDAVEDDVAAVVIASPVPLLSEKYLILLCLHGIQLVSTYLYSIFYAQTVILFYEGKQHVKL